MNTTKLMVKLFLIISLFCATAFARHMPAWLMALCLPADLLMMAIWEQADTPKAIWKQAIWMAIWAEAV